MATNEYRKRPVVVEAFQMTRERREDNSEWPAWLNRARQGKPAEVGTVYFDPLDGRLIIHSFIGALTVSWGDWIIRGVQGELYPCKPYVFEAMYEAVSATTEDGPAAPEEAQP